ncbi:VOC family protein [uncultured Sphingomonas sp.]|uniref:2-oxoadipate dioxygenase/decarboxylase HglS n=1 Tax=uncultured Sphingomonas sp. TaxID=158754 RepID=UPI0035C98374
MAFVPPEEIRDAFSDALSDMYRKEVPLYGTLVDIVAKVDARVAGAPGKEGDVGQADGARARRERHGAIRVGTAAELSIISRIFAVMGMRPVGYYDLAPAGVPVHATAFRPIERRSLDRHPFRVFTSLLRLDLIEDEELRMLAAGIVSRRKIVSDDALALVDRCGNQGGLDASQAGRFVAEVLETFRWHQDACIDEATYHRLLQAHRLVADVVSFQGPHINHLTPGTLDIDAVQREMRAAGIEMKAEVEGPPPRAAPILLRQTSFKAIEEPVRFPASGSETAGTHAARFGEIEQRGVALTRTGRALYDALLAEARSESASGIPYGERLAAAFTRFPDDHATLRREKLAFYRYAPTQAGIVAASKGPGHNDVAALVDAGWLSAEPILYEDFLPVSAAGIFQSNLGDAEPRNVVGRSSQALFEAELGMAVLDPFDLYAAIQGESIDAALASLGVADGCRADATIER